MLSVNQILERLDGLSFAEAKAQLGFFSSYDRTTALVLVLARAPTATDALRIFLEWGCMLDAPWWERSNIAASLREAVAEVSLADFLGPPERRFYEALPQLVPVWRGCERGLCCRGDRQS
jgi:hypothetical protein